MKRLKTKIFVVIVAMISLVAVSGVYAADTVWQSSTPTWDGTNTPQGYDTRLHTSNLTTIQANTVAGSTTGSTTSSSTTTSSTSTSGRFNYKLLEGLPGFFSAGDSAPSLPALIIALYNFGIWTVGIAAMFMIVIGGFMYMTSAGNTSSVASAKGIIKDALLGLAAALGAYLILYVINPDLVKINLNLAKVSIVGQTVSTPSGTAVSGFITQSEALTTLQNAGISVSGTMGLCSNRKQSNCTSLEGISQKALDGIVKFKQDCSGCTVVVTGGSEQTSHSNGSPHYSGKAIDIRTNSGVKSFLSQVKSSRSYGKYNFTQICTTNANSSLRYECNYQETAEHIHFTF
jgi:hypothetical protein